MGLDTSEVGQRLDLKACHPEENLSSVGSEGRDDDYNQCICHSLTHL